MLSGAFPSANTLLEIILLGSLEVGKLGTNEEDGKMLLFDDQSLAFSLEH